MNDIISCICKKKNHFEDELMDKIIINYDYKNTVTNLLENFFRRVKDLTSILNTYLPMLSTAAEGLPETKEVFVQTLDRTKNEIQHFIKVSNDDKIVIENERKRLENLLAQVDSSSLSEMKQSIYNAMSSDKWLDYRQYLFCNPPYGIWAYVLKIVVTENSFNFCDYLLKANSTIETNVLKIYDLLNELSSNKLIIKLRIEQIRKNWLVIVENVDLAEQQPNFFQDCYGLKYSKNLKLKNG